MSAARKAWKAVERARKELATAQQLYQTLDGAVDVRTKVQASALIGYLGAVQRRQLPEILMRARELAERLGG